MAKAPTFIKTTRDESADLPVHEGVMEPDGPPISDSIVDTAKAVGLEEKAQIEKFMDEPVTVLVHESPVDELPVVDVGVNGQTEFFIRGVPKVTKRKFLYQLIRARQTHFQMDEKEGGSVIDYRYRTSQRYPFSVENDTAKGREWLKRIIRGERA